VLGQVFRGKYLQGLRQTYVTGALHLGGSTAALADPSAFAALVDELYRTSWVVYAKQPFGRDPEQVLKYLARYTHRVAISNQRLVALTNGQVTFRYKDYADAQQQKTMTLDALEFLRRFLQHVLPRGFLKIRHYGLLANRHRTEKLKECRRLLLVVNAAAVLACADAGAVDNASERIQPAELPHCPQCGGQRFLRIALPKEEPAVGQPRGDTS
jgi:Putative transposase